MFDFDFRSSTSSRDDGWIEGISASRCDGSDNLTSELCELEGDLGGVGVVKRFEWVGGSTALRASSLTDRLSEASGRGDRGVLVWIDGCNDDVDC